MSEIDATQLQEFVNSFHGSSKSQITIVVGTLKAIFSTAYAEGYIERDPSVALIRPKANRKEERRPLTPEETRNGLEVAETHPDGLILGVLYYLGLRRGEALGLKWGDFMEKVSRFDRMHPLFCKGGALHRLFLFHIPLYIVGLPSRPIHDYGKGALSSFDSPTHQIIPLPRNFFSSGLRRF